MELWGRCRDCDRWFYCERRVLVTPPTCPACGAEASEVVDRGKLRHLMVEMPPATEAGMA